MPAQSTATLPRSALLAAWGSAVLDGRAGPDEARDAVSAATGAGDEPHRVHVLAGAPLGASDGGTLVDLLVDLRRQGVNALRAVLPAPGEVLGLPGPPALNAEAVDAGECVVGVGGPFLALVPQVEAFGSAWEPGAHVTWRVHAAAGPGVVDHGSVAEAERELREVLAEGISALEDLDVARWPDEDAARIDELRHGSGPGHLLPPGSSPRAVRVVDLSWRVQGIAELAAADDGGSVTTFEAGARARTLRRLASVGRRALAAAVNEAASTRL